MSKQKKLKKDELIKAKNLIENMQSELINFTETNITEPSNKLNELRAEEQYLKINGNVINEKVSMADYLKNQKRLKDLAVEISDLQGAVNLAEVSKEEMVENLSLLVYKQINKPVNDEFGANMCGLQKELFEHFKEIAKISDEMRNISSEYMCTLNPISGTRGVYIDMYATSYISEIASIFNVDHTSRMGFGSSVIMPSDLEEEYNKLECSKLK